jgi:hypothetical protein
MAGKAKPSRATACCVDRFGATSRLRGYAEPAAAGRSAFGDDAALGSLLAMTNVT